jgi:cephalosporin-C deacetylase-like acetyl esterase
MTSTLCGLILSVCAVSADELQVFQSSQPKALPEAMVYRYLSGQAQTAIERRRQAYELVKTPEQANAWQEARREFFLRQIGGLPERTPLNAKVVGSLSGEDYRVEKVVFESQPNHHVTGLVYLPGTKPPYPGILVPCGHSHNGKAAEAYQRIAILLAKNGMAALCYDPIGQGERYQVLNRDGTPLVNPEMNPNSRRQLESVPGHPQFNPVEEHVLVGIGSILLGLNTARYRIYDGMRGIDYLLSRPDIDPKRIGCTGNSGGGTLTAYLMALDDRIACAAPACFLTTFERLLEKSGPQDAEQNIFGQLAFGMDEADYVLMRAPKPTLLGAGTRDATFDIRGTWDIFRESKRFYARFELPERVDMVEADEPHGFTEPLRVGATRWMRRWLLNRDDAIVEGKFPVWTDQQLQCSPDGQVLLMPDERSVFDLNLKFDETLAPQREQAWQPASRAASLRNVRKLIGARRLTDLPEPESRLVGTIERAGYRIEKLILTTEPGIELPALVFVPENPNADAYLYLDSHGKQTAATPGGPMEALVREGHWVMAVDLRGLGETELKSKKSSYRLKDQECMLAYLLGKSLVGMRTEDVWSAGRFLAGYRTADKQRQVHVIGVGTAGIPALHAVALEPQGFASLRLKQTLGRWTDVLHTSVPEDQLCSTVHGALTVYDLPDLIRSLGSDKVTVEQPVDAQGKIIGDGISRRHGTP